MPYVFANLPAPTARREPLAAGGPHGKDRESRHADSGQRSAGARPAADSTARPPGRSGRRAPPVRRQDLFERLLASLYAAALDDARWPAASGLLEDFCGAAGNFLVCGDGATQDDVDIFFARFCFRGERDVDIEREYFGIYHALDERIPRIRALPDSGIASNASLLTEAEKKTSVYYNELLPRTGVRDSLVTQLAGPDGSRIVWAIGDPVGGDGWSSGQVEAVGRLLPHIRQYVRVRQTLADARALGSTTAGLLENMRMGVIHLDRRGRVAAANDLARAILRKRDALSDEDGVLRAALPEEDEALQRLVARTAPFSGGTGAGGSMRLSRDGSLSRLALHVSPLQADGPEPGEGRTGVLVLVIDPLERTEVEPFQLEDLLGLTPAQSHVAALLAQGRSIDEIAAAIGRERTTVKWHLRHIYAKHGLTRQVELAQLVMSLADLPDVPR